MRRLGLSTQLAPFVEAESAIVDFENRHGLLVGSSIIVNSIPKSFRSPLEHIISTRILHSNIPFLDLAIHFN